MSQLLDNRTVMGGIALGVGITLVVAALGVLLLPPVSGPSMSPVGSPWPPNAWWRRRR